MCTVGHDKAAAIALTAFPFTESAIPLTRNGGGKGVKRQLITHLDSLRP